MARVYSHDRTLTLKPTIDLIQSEITSIRLAQESFTSNDLAQESLSVEFYDQKVFELESIPRGNAILLSLNGLLLSAGTDYQLDSKDVNINTSFRIDVDDSLIVSYLKWKWRFLKPSNC